MKKLTVDSSATIQDRIKAQPAFAEALLREATDMFLNGEAGNPTMENLTAVFTAIRNVLNITFETHTIHRVRKVA